MLLRRDQEGAQDETCRGGRERRGARSRVATRTRRDLSSHSPVPEGAKSRVRSRKRARAVAPWRRRASRSDRAASAVRDAARRRARLGERAAAGRVRARARSRALAREKKNDDVRKIETARARDERRTPSRRARGGGRDGGEKGTRVGSRGRTSMEGRERAAGRVESSFADASRSACSTAGRPCVSSPAAEPSARPGRAVSDRPYPTGSSFPNRRGCARAPARLRVIPRGARESRPSRASRASPASA